MEDFPDFPDQLTAAANTTGLRWLCGLAALQGFLAGSALQCEREDTAAFRIVLHPDASTMGHNDRFADCETQPDALPRNFLSVLHLMKFMKDSFFVTVRDTGAGIGDRDEDFTILAFIDAGSDFAVAG